MMQMLFDPSEEIIQRHTQSAPVNVDAIARDLGIPVVMATDLGDDVAGKIVRELRGTPSGYVIYVNARDNRRRQRFTLAHEIAHYVLHRDLIGDGLIDSAMYRSKLGTVYERQANWMAANILMPAAYLRGLYKGGMKGLAQLSAEFNVSEEALRIRLKELGLAA